MAEVVFTGPAPRGTLPNQQFEQNMAQFRQNEQVNALRRAFQGGGSQQEQLQQLFSSNAGVKGFLGNAPAVEQAFNLLATPGESIPSIASRFDTGATSQVQTAPRIKEATTRKAEEIVFESLEDIQGEIKSIKEGRKAQLLEAGIEESVADTIVKEDLEFLERQKRGLKDKKAGGVVIDPVTGKASISVQRTVTSEADEKSAQVQAMQQFRREIAESDRLENFLQSISNDKSRERFRDTEKSKRILARGLKAREGLDKIVANNVAAESAIEKVVTLGDEIGHVRDGKFIPIATKKPGQILREVTIGNDEVTGKPIVATGFITPELDAEGNVTGGGTFQAITVGGKDVTGVKGGGITVNVGGDPQPSAERKELLQFKDLNEQIADLQALAKPEFVGFFDNLETKIRQGLDMSSADRDAFARILPDIQNQIVFLRSGKAISLGEMTRLLDAMPKITDRDKVFLNNLTDFRRVFQRMFKNRVDALAAQGFAPSVSADIDPSVIATPQDEQGGDEGLTSDQLDAEIDKLNKELNQ